MAAVPVVLRQFFVDDNKPGSVKMEWGLINTRLKVPMDLRLQPTSSGLWWFYRDKLEAFGPTFRAFLVDHAIPLWRQALVPAQLLELLKGPDFDFPNEPAVADS